MLNVAPLYLTSLYSNDTLHDSGENHYWPDKPSNHTQVADIMHDHVTTVNSVYKYQTPFELLVAKRYPGAEFTLFDVWSLMSDIYDNPTAYLNGSAPANVTGFDKHCNLNGTVCVNEYRGASPDSFMWYDELHPRCVTPFEMSICANADMTGSYFSEQTDRIIARNFVDVLTGNSSYATYYSS